MPVEHLATRVVSRIALSAQFGELLDRRDRHARCFQAHHELQPVQVGRRIEPVPGIGAADDAQQACLLVIAQGVSGDADGLRHLSDR